jgi:hypothetical protein
MSKSWLDARCEGKCDECNREEMLCKEEGICLSERKVYKLHIQFEHNYITFETCEMDEFDKMLKVLTEASEQGFKYITLENYTIYFHRILYWKTEEYDG